MRLFQCRRTYTRIWLFRTSLVYFLFAAHTVSSQITVKPTESVVFLRQLANLILGSDSPVPLEDSRGWYGVVLAAPATALSPLVTSFDAQSRSQQNIGQLLSSISLFDYNLRVIDGVARFGERRIADVWLDIISRSRPAALTADNTSNRSDYVRWLFRQADAVDRARGVRFEREPSLYYERYSEYEAIYNLLTNAESKDDGAWRMHPKLTGYSSISEAKKAIVADWLKYGYKTEIEGADASFRADEGRAGWEEWTDTNARFSTERFYISQQQWIPHTYLFPPPNEWFNLATWINCVATAFDGKAVIHFQLARIQIKRPWMDVGVLIDGKLHLDAGGDLVVSTGLAPSLTTYPDGRMSVFAEELLIVRQIKVEGQQISLEGHPLAFAYPEAVNLAGYMVRVLPKLPK